MWTLSLFARIHSPAPTPGPSIGENNVLLHWVLGLALCPGRGSQGRSSQEAPSRTEVLGSHMLCWFFSPRKQEGTSVLRIPRVPTWCPFLCCRHCQGHRDCHGWPDSDGPYSHSGLRPGGRADAHRHGDWALHPADHRGGGVPGGLLLRAVSHPGLQLAGGGHLPYRHHCGQCARGPAGHRHREWVRLRG